MKFGLALIAIFASLMLSETLALADPELRQMLDMPSAALIKLDLPEGELQAIYAARDDKPAWHFTNGDNGTTAAAFVDSLEHSITYHGLQKDVYPIAAIRALALAATDNDRNQLDLLVTASLLRLAHDLHGDNVDLTDDYPGWNFARNDIDIASLLAKALANGSVNDFITGLAPKNPDYVKLAAALQSYRAIANKGGWQPVDAGSKLLPNDRNPRVEQVRARLEAEDYLPPTTMNRALFDETLEQAVIAYQQRNGLKPDGHIGPNTFAAMNVPITERIEQIRANMERWRQMPDDFPPPRFAVVNIADATIVITDDGKEIYRGPVVVGKVTRKTPFIQSRIRSMIVNPFWHVPTKIAQKDILPKLKKDPHYLEKLGFVISGKKDDPFGDNIDWATMPAQEFKFHLRQSPGDMNSLGHLKFDFNNDFAVYMHGTPHQDLFDKAERNFSSGCIRLRDPDQIGETLLNGTPGSWNVEKIQAAIDDGKTRWIGISNPMPLYVLYWSVFADPETGAINFRKDVYDYDRIFESAPLESNSGLVDTTKQKLNQ